MQAATTEYELRWYLSPDALNHVLNTALRGAWFMNWRTVQRALSNLWVWDIDEYCPHCRNYIGEYDSY